MDAEISLNTPSMIRVAHNEKTVNIECSVKAFPPTTVTWQRNDRNVSTNKTSAVHQINGFRKPNGYLKPYTSVLIVKPDKTKVQFGNYTCVVPDNLKVTKRVELVRKYPYKIFATITFAPGIPKVYGGFCS